MTRLVPARPSAIAAALAVAAAMLLAAVLAPIASAAPPPGLYGATGVLAPAPGTTTDRTPPSDLYRIDPNTGTTTSVGAIGYALTGLALDPTSGILYGVTAAVQQSSTERFLLTIDPGTGRGTRVGSIGTNHIEDIAFDRTGQLFGWNESGDRLARLGKVATAGAVSVQNVGNGAGTVTFGSGLAFSANGVLHGLLNGDYGHVWSANAANGQATRGARLSGSPIRTGGQMSAASFGCDGSTLYAADNDFGDPPTYLVAVETATGEITVRGRTVTGLDALEWVCPGPSTPPATVVKAGRCANVLPALARASRFRGTGAGEFLTGSAGADAIDGMGGEDCIYGLAGDDDLRGGAGLDSIEGGNGSDRIRGDDGRGTLRGGSGDDRVVGGSDADVVQGNAGDDRLWGAAGADQIAGGFGNDVIVGGAGRDSIEGGRGNDRISARDGSRDVIDCGFGRDVVVSRDRADRLISCERRARP